MKVWLIVATSLVALGLILFVGVMAVHGFDFSKLGTQKLETNTYSVQDPFSDITIRVDTTDIEFLTSDNGECKVVCDEQENLKHQVEVQDGSLVIRVLDTRKWYEHIGITTKSPKMILYLPNSAYSSLSIHTHTGDVQLPRDFSFADVQIQCNTSSISCFSSVTNTLQVDTDTGSVRAEGITAGAIKLSTDTGSVRIYSVTTRQQIELETNTGAIKMRDVSCNSVQAECDTGGVTLERVIVTETISVETDTGNVKFEDSDARDLYITTDTGSVKGTLLSDKVFFAKSDTGRVDVPKTVTGGRCEIETDTGDIVITVKTKSEK